jgi:hypothetical protein
MRCVKAVPGDAETQEMLPLSLCPSPSCRPSVSHSHYSKKECRWQWERHWRRDIAERIAGKTRSRVGDLGGLCGEGLVGAGTQSLYARQLRSCWKLSGTW